eukprot:TRINITY_DN11199_c0_g1_i1.p1 TRINITY_DN11199_c0_g1~~TRINITY_DN11199_c0_g1_i1.p1  ORF type:complete len:962 (-),score=123.90 TRINITY_DN11199_c0_g1_i1:560-3445(-)
MQLSEPADCVDHIGCLTEETEVPPEEWKRRGNEAYKAKDWTLAQACYSNALKLCLPGTDLETTCLNNRAACFAQVKDHARAMEDATEVVRRQPANCKALLRRMVAREALGLLSEALEDASAVLTIDPKNAHALQVVERKRKSLSAGRAQPSAVRNDTSVVRNDKPSQQTANATRTSPAELIKGEKVVPASNPTDAKARLSVLLITENRPLQCFVCLQSLRKHVSGATLHVHVLWHASEPRYLHSYQLLQSLPEVSVLLDGQVSWTEVQRGKAFESFVKLINKLSVQRHVLLLSDCVLFHANFNPSSILQVLEERDDVFSARLDVSTNSEYFEDDDVFMCAPQFQHFAKNEEILLWTRWYDTGRMAYEKVPRESGWNSILNWTATIVRLHHVQHFFSALSPPPSNFQELDDRAADWLSRRQRMKASEIGHRSACYASPLLVRQTTDGSSESDGVLRRMLYKKTVAQGGFDVLARRIGWDVSEIQEYFAEFSGSDQNNENVTKLDEYLDTIDMEAYPCTFYFPRQLSAPSPLVSWLISARNCESHVLDCLLSIEAQTKIGPGASEIVVVNDASDDDTLSLLRTFASKRPNVHIINNDAQLGVARSLRAGWARCHGDFVARVDADDVAEPQRLAVQLGFLEKNNAVSVVGSRTRAFWTEERHCTVEQVSEKAGGCVYVVAWREFHGSQTSRQREQFKLVRETAGQVIVSDGPSELNGCRVTRVGATPISHIENLKEALMSVQGVTSGLILERRDTPEQPKGCRWLHPLLIRAASIFEDSLNGTTVCFRRNHFLDQCPYPEEEAECHWCWLGLGNRHAANVGEALVLERRHACNRRDRDHPAIHESQCAAIVDHLREQYSIEVGMQDAASLLNHHGPRNAEQGARLLEALADVERCLISRYVRPKHVSEKADFWKCFVSGKEKALEDALASMRLRFKAKVDAVAEVITSVPDESPRTHKERQPPR